MHNLCLNPILALLGITNVDEYSAILQRSTKSLTQKTVPTILWVNSHIQCIPGNSYHTLNQSDMLMYLYYNSTLQD